MGNLYSITTNQTAIAALFRVVNRYVGNLPPMPGVFPDYPAPIVRTGTEGREQRAVGDAVVSACANGSREETRRQIGSQGEYGRLQRTAPHGAGQRHNQHPQREK
jgi:hypothetical protein